MGRKGYIDYYLQILFAFRGHEGHLPAIAWEAAWVVCLYHAGKCEWRQAVDVCGMIWAVFKLGEGKQGPDGFFTGDIVIRLYELYIQSLRASGTYSFKLVYELTLEYREIVRDRYGCDTSIWLKVLIALARVCEEHEDHYHEAVTYYKEVVTRTTTTTVTTITEEEITIVKKRLSKIYISVIAKEKDHKHPPQLADEALQICWALYLEYKVTFGCWHVETLKQFERVLLIHFHLGGQHRAKMLGLVKALVLDVVVSCADSMAAHRAGLLVSAMLVSVGLHVEVQQLLLKLHHVITLPGLPCDHDHFELEWKHDRKISLVFVFTCLRGFGHCQEKSYTEVMSAVLLEIQLYNDFKRACEAKVVDVEIFLQISARLHRFWHLAGRSALCAIVMARVCSTFRTSDVGQCLTDVSDEKVLLLIEAMLVHVKDEGKVEDMGKTICIAVNHSVKELLLAGKFTRALDLARVMLVLSKYHDFWSRHTSLGYKLAEHMAGIDVPKTADKKLLKAMVQTSREITDVVLEALHRADVQLHMMQLCDVTGLLTLLGWQENFRALERLLLSLWQSREVQRTWRSSTVLSIGHALVHAHIAAGHLDQAVTLCDTICYNLRRSGEWLDEQAILASNLLAEIYTFRGEHDKAIAIYEEDLRAVIDEESREVFARWATPQLELLRSAVSRNDGFPRNINSYKDMFARLSERGIECDHAEWPGSEVSSEGAGCYKRPQGWYVIGEMEGQGQLKRHNSLSRIAARRSRGVQKLHEVADPRSISVV